MTVVRELVLALALLGLACPCTQADLAGYVKKPTPEFTWKLVKQRELLGNKLYEVEMTSQTWQGITWKHDLLIVLPANVKPTATMALWNQGGKISETTALMAVGMASKMKAPLAFLFGIPNQPLFGNLKEDALIAETFVRYLTTKDSQWPLLFPMVKSLVRAMDTLQVFAKQEWKTDVKHFVVTGASKRGWTTWLTAVADPRVKAIVPMVIDTLNIPKQMPYQLKSYGAYSDMIADYTRRDLVPPPMTPEGQKLWQMVDPWVYRDQIKVPKLIINGTNDPYWTQDALNLYWDDLAGEKWLLYVPNAGHNLTQKKAGKGNDVSRAINTLGAFVRSQVHDRPLPKLSWKQGKTGDKYTLEVVSDQPVKAVRLWQAEAPTRDFRKAEWRESHLSAKEGIRAAVEPPTKGSRVFFIECEYEQDGLTFYFSTQLRILDAAGK